jgi:dsDNA-specific endonuclease/ATPase MutS2
LDDHTLELLEWNVILDEIASSCFSETGGRLVYEQEILTEPAEVSKLLNLSLTARRLLESGATFPHVDFPDIDPFFTPLAKQGAVLTEELYSGIRRNRRAQEPGRRNTQSRSPVSQDFEAH